MKTHQILLLIFVIILANSCNLINPDEGSPAFIYIEEIDFEGELTDSHKITEIWIFANGRSMGAFDLPARIPILEEGLKEVKFRAGIKNNGSANSRIMYPFYTEYSQFIDFEPLKTDTIVPYFTIKDGVTYPLPAIANFESSGSNYNETSISAAVLIPQDIAEEALEGKYGYVELTSSDSLWQTRSPELILPRNEFVFLELDYKCSNSFAAGLTANIDGVKKNQLELVLSPTTDELGIPQWEKIYIDLGIPISLNMNATSFNVLFESRLDPSNSVGKVWLDNISVVHFD